MNREQMIDVLKMNRDLAMFNPMTGEYVPMNEVNAESAVALDMAIKELEVPAIPLDWIRGYIDRLKAMGVQIALRDAQAVSVMVDKWAMDNSKCGPDYCEIGGTHNE